MEKPEIYTQENIVFKDGVKNADITKPILVLNDDAGNHALTDGNHRAFRALQDGKLNVLERDAIGRINGDVSKHPDYKHISELKVIEK